MGIKENKGVSAISPFMFSSVNLISDCLLMVSGCGQDRGQSLLLVRWGRGTREVSFCHHWCWMGHQTWQIGCAWMKTTSYLCSHLTSQMGVSLELTFTMSAPALPQISIQPVFRQRPEMKSNLIPDLVKNRRITPDIILQYCRSAAHSTVSSLMWNIELNFGRQVFFSCLC